MTAITAPLVLVWRRLRANWRFQLVVFAGVLMATTLLAGAPLYLNSIEELGLRHSLQFERTGVLDTAVLVPFRPLDESGYAQTSTQVDERVNEGIGELVMVRQAHIRMPGYDVLLPGQTTPRVMSAIQSFSEYEEHTRVVEGRFPRSLGPSATDPLPLEVAIGANAARSFGVGLDDTITILPAGAAAGAIDATIVGIVEPIDFSEVYWSFNLDPFSPQTDGSTGAEIPLLPVMVPPEALLVDVVSGFRGTLVSYWWYYFIDASLIEARDVDETRASMAAIQDDLSIALPGTTVLSGLGDTLRRFDQKLFFSRIPMQIMIVIVMAIVLYYLIMVANTVVDRHLGEIALLRSRGANGLQVLGIYLWEALILALIAVVLGPLLANLLVPPLGFAPAFRDATGGDALPTSLTGSVFLFALLGGGLSFLALFIPALRRARFSLLDVRALATRPGRFLFFHTYYLDIFLLALAGILYWELTERGTLVTQSVLGEDSVDVLLLAAPVIIMLAFALVFLRAVPLLLALAAGLASGSSRVWLSMGLWNLGRNPVPYLRPTLLLTLIVGMAIFAASYNDTLERSFKDRGLFPGGKRRTASWACRRN